MKYTRRLANVGRTVERGGGHFGCSKKKLEFWLSISLVKHTTEVFDL